MLKLADRQLKRKDNKRIKLKQIQKVIKNNNTQKIFIAFRKSKMQSKDRLCPPTYPQ